MSEIPTEFAPKEIVFPTNPIISAQYIKILRPNLPLNLLLPFLDYPNLSFQKSAAYAIYNLTEDKTQLQKQALNSLIQAEESLPFPTEAPNLNIRNTGIIVLCMYLTDQPILISEYMKALYPILLDETQKNAATQAQLLLSTLMKYNSTEFHHFDILSLVRKQFEHHNLRPQFLLSFINTFGIYSIRKFCIEVLSQCIEDFDTNGLQYIKVFIPYLMHFPYEKQLELHKFLTEQCEKRRFDSELFITTAKSFAAIAPTVSLYCGRFMEAAKLSFVNSSVKAILRPLLEPNGPQPPQEVHNIIVLADDEKCDVETLAEPSTVSVGVQYESI
ncbi:hypothetical protein GPJ56_003473 [Histomonas meleagridis]|uniref:uncharacterized protein n=1 Tax=Histomonas meleagridis TaxID=135588 RepID=UPI00355991DB|nr:hypothetical protein GPJ56_003473 [Histomonas meleagridis]KAH0799165.1 hypothetical protein GO595_007962 [Histomonas meleagridis]